MADEQLDFNFTEAQRTATRIRSCTAGVESAFKSLQSKLDESSVWWNGPSHDSFVKQANVFLARKNAVIRVIDAMAEDMEKAIEEQRRGEEEVCALITSSSGEQTVMPNKSINLEADSGASALEEQTAWPDESGNLSTTPGADVQNGKLERNAQLISFDEGTKLGLIGIYCSLDGKYWFENKMIYDPVPCLSTQSITLEQAADLLIKSYLADGSWESVAAEIMGKDVEHVSAMQMMILIGVLDGLVKRGELNGDMSEVEKFIELSYILVKEVYPTSDSLSADPFEYFHNLSPVLIAMAGIMGEFDCLAEVTPERLRDENDEIHRTIFITQLLTSLVLHNPSMMVAQSGYCGPSFDPTIDNAGYLREIPKPEVKFYQIEHEHIQEKWRWDYSYTIDTSYLGTIDIYQYRPYLVYFNAVFLEDKMRYLKLEQSEVVKKWIAENGIEKAMSFLLNCIPVIGGAIDEISSSAFDLMNAIKENNEFGIIADKETAKIYYPSLSDAACLGASLTFTTDGILLNVYCIRNKDMLGKRLAQYREDNKGCSLDLQEFERLLSIGDYANEELVNYVSWYLKVCIMNYPELRNEE